VRIRSQGDLIRSRQSEICKFGVTMPIKEYVLRLEVPVENTLGVEIGYSLKDLVQVALCYTYFHDIDIHRLLFGKGVEILLHILVQVLEHQVKLGICGHYIFQTHDIWIVQLA
jgi:hypothetical protein